MPAKKGLTSVNEQILVEAARIYDAREQDGVEAKHLPKDLLERAINMRPPRDRYVGEKIQNESVAIETAGITIVRRGKARVTWKGPQTVSAFPYLEKLSKMEGIVDFLSTEFCLSTEKNFPMVEFVDTPGLTDGTLKYPFDVDEAIMELAEHATMIMVFLDPIGKALVSRCMNVVQRLAVKYSAKMSFYLSKFDTAGDEVDRTNVVSQIVQELQGRVKATHALKLHTIFLPERAGEDRKGKVPNKIQDLCQNISKEIDSRVQDVLDQLSKDCAALSSIVDEKVERNKKCVSHNMKSGIWKLILSSFAMMVLSAILYWAFLNRGGYDPMEVCPANQPTVTQLALPDGATITEKREGPAAGNLYCFLLTTGNGVPALIGLVLALAWTVYMWLVKTPRVEQLSGEEMRKLKAIQEDIRDNIISKHKALKKRLTEDVLEDSYGN